MAEKQKKKPSMLKVLKAQSAVLDSIIVRQTAIHDTVMAKDWISLEDSMLKMDRLSERFLALEEQRIAIEQETIFSMRSLNKNAQAKSSEDLLTDSSSDKNSLYGEETAENEIEMEPMGPLLPTFEERAALYGERKVSEALMKVRTKLARSKIENNALNAYVSAAGGFIKGVLDSVIPQRRNTTYNRYGKMAKPMVQSLVIDRVF